MNHHLYSLDNPEYAAAFDAEQREIAASSAETNANRGARNGAAATRACGAH